ncbi:MAG TPA: MFS transporter, partial [Phototrophicaceae bacterium]|nr:MFS transporter [Phototrophicaceae bacterium]
MDFAAPVVTYVRSSVAGLPRAFWYLWLGTLINRLGLFISPFLTLFLTSQRGLTVEHATLLISLEGLGSFVAQISGGFFCDHFGRRLTMLISFFVSPVLMIMLYQETTILGLVVLILLYGFFIDLYRPASGAMIADVVPPEDRVRAFSLRYWAVNLGAAGALSLAGFLA